MRPGGLNAALIPIGDWQLALAVILVLLAGGVSAAFNLGLLRSLAWGTVRAFLQLTIIGYVLVYIFRWNDPWITGGLLVLMGTVAAWTAVGRAPTRGVLGAKERGAQDRTPARFLLARRCPVIHLSPLAPLSLVSLLSSTFLVAAIVVGLVISPHPWYSPRVLITITGMIMGNSMNAIALAWERLHSDVARSRREVEALLSFGATPWEAVADSARLAVRAGMLPTVNTLAVVGLVTLPGMMTGQILAGADPREAVRYQIVVMLMITAATALGCLLMVALSYRRLFTADGALAPETGPEKTAR